MAVSDSPFLTAQGRPTLRRTSWDADLQYLRGVVEENEVETIVVGKPLHMGGQESPQSRKVARFATKLSKTLGLPVILWDERLTSFAAEQHLEEAGLKWRERKNTWIRWRQCSSFKTIWTAMKPMRTSAF